MGKFRPTLFVQDHREEEPRPDRAMSPFNCADSTNASDLRMADAGNDWGRSQAQLQNIHVSLFNYLVH